MTQGYLMPFNLPSTSRREMKYLKKKGVRYPAQTLLLEICLQTAEIVAGEEEQEDEDEDSKTISDELLQACMKSEGAHTDKADGKYDPADV